MNLYKENRDPVEINARQSHIERLQSVAVSLDSGQIRNKIKRTNFLSLQQETLNLKPFIFLSQPTFQLKSEDTSEQKKCTSWTKSKLLIIQIMTLVPIKNLLPIDTAVS